MLTVAQTDFLGNIDEYPFHKPIFDNILSNFNPKSTSRYKKLTKEEHEHRLAVALVCRAWCEKVLTPDDETSLQLLPLEDIERIFFHIKPKIPTIFRRIEGEYEERLKTWASVSHACRNMVFCPTRGPLKALGKDHFKLLPRMIPWELLIGVANQEIMKRSEASEPWFKYLGLVRQGVEAEFEAECPVDADPNVLNYAGESPFSIAYSLCVKDREKYGFLIEQLPAAKLSDAILVRAFRTLFTSYGDTDNLINDALIARANKVVARVKANGNEWMLHEYLKPEIADILRDQETTHDMFKFCAWLEEIGVGYTVDALFYMIYSLSRLHDFREAYLPFFKRVFTEMDIPLDAELESGNHLIHALLDDHDLLPLNKAELVQIILNKFPHEIGIPDKRGHRLLTILFIKKLDSMCESLKGYISEEAIMDQREECHAAIKSDLAFTCIEELSCATGDEPLVDEYSQRIVDYFSNLKKLFSSEKAFESWLLEFNEESLLHEIAFWKPAIIGKMLDAKLITKKMCEEKNDAGNSVIRICEKQDKLFKTLKNPNLEVDIDRETYACFNDKVKKMHMAPVIFDLFDKTYNNYPLDPPPLLKKLILLDPNITDSSGNNLLHAFFSSSSCKTNKLPFLLYLLDHGVDPNLLNDENKNPLDIARKFNRRFAYPLLQNI